MNIKYIVIGSLQNLIQAKQPQGEIEVEENSKVGDLCDQLGLNKKMQMVILINKEIAMLDTILSDQVEVTFVPVVSGG